MSILNSDLINRSLIVYFRSHLLQKLFENMSRFVTIIDI